MLLNQLRLIHLVGSRLGERIHKHHRLGRLEICHPLAQPGDQVSGGQAGAGLEHNNGPPHLAPFGVRRGDQGGFGELLGGTH